MGPLYSSEAPRAAAPSPWYGFAPSSPLFLAATALFIGGYAVWRYDAAVGPGYFPLWDLLVVLGFVSAIGGVLSWFFASGDSEGTEREPEPPVVAPPRAAPSPRARPTTTSAPRGDLGRPRPDVVSRSRAAGHASGFSAALATTPPNAPPWEEDEDELDEPPVPLPSPPVEPIPRTEVEQMLRELDGIEREAGRRRSPGVPSTY